MCVDVAGSLIDQRAHSRTASSWHSPQNLSTQKINTDNYREAGHDHRKDVAVIIVSDKQVPNAGAPDDHPE